MRKVSVSKWFTALVVLTTVMACSPKNDEPPGPCTVGLNSNVCSLNLSGSSQWRQKFEMSSKNPESDEVIYDREIEINYIFTKNGDTEGAENRFLRQLLVRDRESGQVYTMWDRGVVLSVEGDVFELLLEDSTCESDVSTKMKDAKALWIEKIYYNRNGDSIQISQSPIEKEREFTSLGNLFGNMIADVMTSMVVQLVKSVFTFGSVKQYMRSSEGNFSLVREDFNFERGIKGCFHSLGSGFTKSKTADEGDVQSAQKTSER